MTVIFDHQMQILSALPICSKYVIWWEAEGCLEQLFAMFKCSL